MAEDWMADAWMQLSQYGTGEMPFEARLLL
jgi:hypothetical protein